MRKGILSMTAAAAALALGLTACGGESGQTTSSTASATASQAPAGKIGVILPDSKSSVRWETQDRRFLAAAFKAAGVSYSIVNAENSAQTQRTQAEQAIRALCSDLPATRHLN